MKDMKYNITFCIALVCVMLFTTCNNIEPPEFDASSAYGRIRVTIEGVDMTPSFNMRTVFPTIAFDKYVYAFTKAGETDGVVLTPDTNGNFALKLGNYTAAVQAYISNAGQYTLAASGVSSEFSVNQYSTTVVSVFLSGVDTGGEGKFTYTITYPADAGADLALQKLPGLENITLNYAAISAGNGITETLDLAAGSYLITVLLNKTGLFTGISEVIHIYPLLSTVYTKNYVDGDFLAKLPGAAVGAPMLDSFTADSITVYPVDPPGNGQIVEYGINTSATAPSTWQTGLTFTGFNGGVYYVFSRSAENYDYTSGAANVGFPVMVVTTTAQWNNALTVIRNGGSGTAGNPKTYPIMVRGDVAVPGSAASTTSFGLVQHIEATLKGSGTLSLNSVGSILRLDSNQTLIIDDENLTLQGRPDNNTAVVYVQSGGTLELKNGAISGNASSTNGGGVYVAGGTFTMSGGTVYGGDIGSPLANTAASGAALYLNGGTAVYGDGSNILPHTDNRSSYTNNIIPGYSISGTGTFTYDGSARIVTITPKKIASPGAITVLYNGTETPPVNAEAYTITFNVAAAPGFKALTGLSAGTINITRAAGAPVSAPANAPSVTHNSITINPVSPPANGQTVEYARSTTNTAPSSGWQDSTTFNNLTAGTNYYIFARSKQITNYNAGTASASLLVTTLQTVLPGRIEYYWVNEHNSLATTSGGSTTIIAGETLTITAQGTGYTVRQWHVNGFTTGQSGNTYAFSSTKAGMYTVGLFVEKEGKLYNTNIIITVRAKEVRTVTIDMYDAYGDGWNSGGALRINVNGIQVASNVRVSAFTNTYSFSVETGDVVEVYWYVASGSAFQTENSFIVYYADTPPVPRFYTGSTSSQSNVGPTAWSGTNALLYRLRTISGATGNNYLNGVANGTLLGSFTVLYKEE